VDLTRPDGSKAVSIDNAPSVIGWNWRAEDYIVSSVRLNVPADATGEYALRLSLFDPNQKKNAVYFDPREPGEPIIAIIRPLTVKPG
jgi:hypothetical protein